MNLRQYVSIFAFGTLVSLVAWILVVLNIDPVSNGPVSLVLFFVSLFAAMVGFFTTVGTVLRGLRANHASAEVMVQTSLRQSILLGCLVVLALMLLRNEAFTAWTMLLSVLALSFVEAMAQSAQRAKKRPQFEEAS